MRTDHSGRFCCGSSGLALDDPYNGGAAFLAFLAREFGEGIHARLPRSSARTFEAALAGETRPYSREQLFDRFCRWPEATGP